MSPAFRRATRNRVGRSSSFNNAPMPLHIARDNMKLAKLAPASLLAVAVALSFAAVGCHKGLDKTTHIPIGQMRPPGDDSARPPRSGDPGLSPGGFTTPGNIGSTPTPPIT